MLQIDMLELVEGDPTLSTTATAAQKLMFPMVKCGRRYPITVLYLILIIQRIQMLQPKNHSKRVAFCQWLLKRFNRTENFIKIKWRSHIHSTNMSRQ